MNNNIRYDDPDYKQKLFEALGVTEEEARDWNILEIAAGGYRFTEPPLSKSQRKAWYEMLSNEFKTR